jgi:hypothetical protein
MLNVIQIQAQRLATQQLLNYYLSRMSAVFAVSMFIDNIATLVSYFLVGGAFRVMYVCSSYIHVLMSSCALWMLTFSTQVITHT